MCKFIGIDISKQTFDVSFQKKSEVIHRVFKNNKQGFEAFFTLLIPENIVVMEASGPYYVQLATFLYEHQIDVSVVNPLKIKRFSQMNFNRAKTDKKDAEVIRQFAVTMHNELLLWKPKDNATESMKQIHTALELLRKQERQIDNQLGAFTETGNLCKDVEKELKSLLKSIKKRIVDLEKKLTELANENYRSTMDSLTSIPGIGIKTASLLIAITDNFEKFKTYKQLLAYVGLSPRIYQSGISVRGKSHICKMGNPQIRKLLYMCSWTAIKYNKKCNEMYERLKLKGKPGRLICVAIANKLLKQCFAMAKNQSIYDPDFAIA